MIDLIFSYMGLLYVGENYLSRKVVDILIFSFYSYSILKQINS